MDPNQLVRIYPWLDHMLAETIIKMHEQGTLRDYVDALPERHEPTSEVVVGAITVEPPAEKIVALE
jgi:hypothetical protein